MWILGYVSAETYLEVVPMWRNLPVIVELVIYFASTHRGQTWQLGAAMFGQNIPPTNTLQQLGQYPPNPNPL